MKSQLFKKWCIYGVLLLALFGSVSYAQENVAISQSGAVEEFVPMRDGVKLAADVYKPEGEGPWPVILSRTPYLKDRGRPGMYKRYTDAGYVYVIQDVRGQGKSEGTYRAFYNDRQDGYDTVEWAAKQPWSNGKVGITGGSALGITANLAATSGPPSLVAAYVRVAPHSQFFEVTWMGGVLKQADTLNWMSGRGSAVAASALNRGVYWTEERKAYDIAANLHNVTIPMFNDGGWYDIFNVGNVRNFMYLQEFGAPGAKGRQKLSMGPVGHGPLSGDLAYDLKAGMSQEGSQEIRWFNYWLKGENNGILDEPPVRYYMMASAQKGKASPLNGWRTAEQWPPPNQPTRYYLQPQFKLTTSLPPKDAKAVSYKFDPKNPVPTVGGANLTFERGPMDQRKIGQREDYLRFETEPLTASVVITGPVTAEVWVTTDAPDTDFIAKLVDVYPDGYEAIVLDSPLRTRFRYGRRLQDVKMMTPGEPALLKIDLWHTAITFEPGHKIALHITSSSTPRFEVNDNNGTEPGGPFTPRIATNAVLLDADHPSAVVLPVMMNCP